MLKFDSPLIHVINWSKKSWRDEYCGSCFSLSFTMTSCTLYNKGMSHKFHTYFLSDYHTYWKLSIYENQSNWEHCQNHTNDGIILIGMIIRDIKNLHY